MLNQVDSEELTSEREKLSTKADTAGFSEGLISAGIPDMHERDQRTLPRVLNTDGKPCRKRFRAASGNHEGSAYGKGEQYEI